MKNDKISVAYLVHL